MSNLPVALRNNELTEEDCKILSEAINKKLERFFFDQDDDSHWYIIPIQRKEEWKKFLEDEEGWDTPFYDEAIKWMISGHPNSITFENPNDN